MKGKVIQKFQKSLICRQTASAIWLANLRYQGLEEYVRIKYVSNNRNMSVEEEDEILKRFDDEANAGQIINAWKIKRRLIKSWGGIRARPYLYAAGEARTDKEEASSETSKEGGQRRNRCIKKY